MQFPRPLTLTVLLVFLVAGVSAQSFSIKDECGDREENMFSIYNLSGGHVAEPGFYDNQVCASGVEEIELSKTCPDNLNSILNLYQRNNSHASIYNAYDMKVCASLPADINNSCPDERKIISMEYLDDSHVAEPGALEHQLCAGERSVRTVKMEMTFEADEVYVDGEPASEGTYSESTLEYPYIVSGEPAGIVSYGEPLSIEYSTDGTKDTLSVTQKEGSFILPNTEGSYSKIENREEMVRQRTFIDQLSPNFAYLLPDTPRIRVIYDPSINITGFEREQRGRVDLYVRHRSDDNPEPVIEIGLD